MFYSKRRFEYFNDGIMVVIAIITILEIPVNSVIDNREILKLLEGIMIFFINFFVIGIFWHRHHEVIDKLEILTSKIIWTNHFFLFFLSLLPVFTILIIRNLNEVIPLIGYDIIFLLVNISFLIVSKEVYKQTADDKFEKLPAIRKIFRKYSWAIIIIQIIIFIGVIIIIINNPKLSLLVFIIFTMLTAFVSMFFEEQEIKNKLKKRTISS